MSRVESWVEEIDDECIMRRHRNLPLHFKHHDDCSKFFKCSSRNVKYEIVCIEDQSYDPETGRCSPTGLCYGSDFDPNESAVVSNSFNNK